MNANRTQIQKILKTDKLIKLALIQNKFIKDQLLANNKNIKKLVNIAFTIVCFTLL